MHSWETDVTLTRSEIPWTKPSEISIVFHWFLFPKPKANTRLPFTIAHGSTAKTFQTIFQSILRK